MAKSNAIDTTQGNYKNLIWKLSWPIAITNLIHVAYNWADSIWVSQMQDSTQAISAVSISFTIVFILVAFAMGLSTATTTLISQYYGAKKYDKVMATAYTSLTAQIMFAIIIVSTGLIFKKQLFALLNTPADVLPYAYDYFTIIISGMIFMFISFIFQGILRGLGDTKTPMYMGIIAGVLNAVLDPFLILGWGPFPVMGIQGAAYATVFARMVTVVILAYKVFGNKFHFKLELKKFGVDYAIFKQILKIGIPASISQMALSMGGMLLMMRINVFGSVAAASHGLGARMDALVFTVGMSLSQAAATIVGQNLGAGLKDRALAAAKYAVKAGFIATIAVCSIFAVYPNAYLFMFNVEPAVIELTSWYIRFLCAGYAFLSVRIILNGIFLGAGAANTQMFMTLISLFIFRLPFAYALSYTNLGVRGVWLGISLSFVVSAFVMYMVFKKSNWMDKAITHTDIPLEKGKSE